MARRNQFGFRRSNGPTRKPLRRWWNDLRSGWPTPTNVLPLSDPPPPATGSLTRTPLFASSIASGGSTASWSSSAFTPPSNSLLVAVVSGMVYDGNADPSANLTVADSTGLVWTRRIYKGSATNWSMGGAIFTAPVTTGASMTVTVHNDAGLNFYNYAMTVVAYEGADPTSPIGATGVADVGVTDGPLTLTLDALPASSSEVIGQVVIDLGGTPNVTVGADYVELGEYDDFGSASEVQVRVSNVASTSWGWPDVDGGGGSYGRTIAMAVEIKAAPAAGGTTGAAALTQGADTAAGSGGPIATGTAALTQGAQTAAASGTPVVTGAAALTQGAQAATATGTTVVTGAAAVTQGADTVVAAGVVGAGSAALTQGPDTATGAGTPVVTGAAALTQGAQTVAASGTPAASGAAALTQGAQTAAGAGAPVVSGQGGAVAAPDTVAGAGSSTVVGSSAATQGADTATASGTPVVTGTGAMTQAADTSFGEGAQGSMTAPGTLTLTMIAPTLVLTMSAPSPTLTLVMTAPTLDLVMVLA